MASIWDDVSIVIGSTYRTDVLARLATGPATPSQLATDTEQDIAHISRALNKLREHALVELLVSDERQKGRVYGITERGTEVWETIDEHNLAAAGGRLET